VLAAHEVRFEEFLCDLFAKFVRDDAGAHAEHVRVVVEARKFARLEVATDGGADALPLVGGHAHSDARATDEDAAVGFLGQDFVAHLVGVNRIVAGVGRVGPHVEYGIALTFEVGLELVFVFYSGVVTADGDSFEHFWTPGITS